MLHAIDITLTGRVYPTPSPFPLGGAGSGSDGVSAGVRCEDDTGLVCIVGKDSCVRR